MPYYAQLNQENVVFSVAETSDTLPAAPHLVLLDGLRSDLLGHVYNPETGEFDAPVVVAPPEPEWAWCVDIGSFFDRFGAAKMAVLTSADPGVQAILKDTQIRKWLDLKLPEVAQSVAYVGTKVPAVTAELQDAILNTPVAPAENLALRKLYFS